MSVLAELSQLHRRTGEWHAAVDFATTALRIAERLDDGRSRRLPCATGSPPVASGRT
jgi:hypothetical protein